MSYKDCNQCFKNKTLDLFGRDITKKDKISNKCKDCTKTNDHLRYLKNKDSVKNRNGIYRNSHIEETKIISKNYREKNREIINKKKKEDYDKNIEVRRAEKMISSKKYPDKINANNAKRKCNILNRTPSWLSMEDFKVIEGFYFFAKKLETKTGDKYHVDHIIPLNGKNVSGLHVPSNLQVILAKDNLKKSNK
jgi:hypothetical protein